MLSNMRGWAPVKDNVKQIRYLLNEHKANNFVKVPDAAFEKEVAEKLGEIQNVIKGFPEPKAENMDAVGNQVFGLKKMLREKLYG